MEQLFRLIIHDAGTDIVVPDTGLFTADKASGGGSYLFGIILAGACLVVIASVVALRVIKRKRICKFTCNSIVPILIAGIAITVPVLKNSFTNATIKNIDFSVAETVTATIDREKGETSVVIPVDITINETTPSGYDLYMYGGELTDGTNAISQISGDNVAITTGTWGVVVGGESAPTIDDAVWSQIGSSSSPKKVSTADGEIAAGTTIRVYYGITIDDSTPAGAYSTTIGFSTILDLGTTLEESYKNAGVEKVTVGSNSYYPIQGMTVGICNNTTTVPDSLQVVDTRDNTIYTIGKLADNRCWLLDNLALDLTADGASTSITSENTNADTTSLNALFHGGRVSGDNTTKNLATAGVAESNWNSIFIYSAPFISKAYKDTVNESDPIDANKASRYGIYYNYCAASAGSYCYGSNTSPGASQGNAKYDICPAGWRMPTGTDVGEYQSLYNAYDSDIVNFRTALLLPLSGSSSGFSATGQGSSGYFWSSIRNADDSMYSLGLNSSSANTTAVVRYSDTAVRCIARDGNEPDPNPPVDPDPDTTTFDEAYDRAGKTKDFVYGKYKLNEMYAAICSAVTTGQTGQLVDVRDGTIYNVGKLADERCWMLDNLALDLTATGASTNINAANTNANATSLRALFGSAVRAASDPNGKLATAGVAEWASSNSYSAPLINKASKGLVNSADPIEAIRTSKYGFYYNYCAASAGSYCYGSDTNYGTSYDRPDTLIDAEYDICPAGWRMPTGADASEYQTLFGAYNSNTTDFRTALLSPLSGYYYNGLTYNQGVYGSFWSSTRSDVRFMYTLYVSSSIVSPSYNVRRLDGNPVRCIAK